MYGQDLYQAVKMTELDEGSGKVYKKEVDVSDVCVCVCVCMHGVCSPCMFVCNVCLRYSTGYGAATRPASYMTVSTAGISPHKYCHPCSSATLREQHC